MKFDDPFSRPFGAAKALGAPLIANFERGLLVGMDRIDCLHREFVDMVNALAEVDDQAFAPLFERLLTHTQGHFEFENTRMEETDFSARSEHKKEHQRVLNELAEINEEIKQGRVAEGRRYVCEYLPSWFRFHVINMDCALAAHLGNQQKDSGRKK